MTDFNFLYPFLTASKGEKYTCKKDGYYYRNDNSFYHCHDDDYTVQYCAAGKNTSTNIFISHELSKSIEINNHWSDALTLTSCFNHIFS